MYLASISLFDIEALNVKGSQFGTGLSRNTCLSTMLVFYIAAFYFYFHVTLSNPAATVSNFTQSRESNPETSQKEQLLDSSFNDSKLSEPVEPVESFEDRIKRTLMSPKVGRSLSEPDLGGNDKPVDACMATICDENAIVAKVIGHMSGTFVRKEDLFANQREQEDRMNVALNSVIQSALQAIEKKINSTKTTPETRATKDGTAVPIADTRGENLLPAEYRSKGRGVYYELKKKTVIGLTNHFGHPSHAAYTMVATIVPWVDVTGGHVTQLAIAGHDMRLRAEDPDTKEWGEWSKPS